MTQRKRKRIMREFRMDEISVCDEPAQEGARAMLMKRAGVETDKAQFEKFTPIAEEQRAMTEFEKRADEIVRVEKCSPMEAMRRARLGADPEEFEAYRAGPSYKPVAKDSCPGKAKAEREFNAAVARTARENGISRTAAMRRVRQESPKLYEALQLTKD